MKRVVVGTALLMLTVVIIFTASARAAQLKYSSLDADGRPVDGGKHEYYYLSTPTRVYQQGWTSSFAADGTTNYPYEPYLPNETSPADYRIHTNFTRDSDACASCHATHTAVGRGLLQWYSIYETCMACHDGTVSTTYNVINGTLPDGSPAPAGMFGRGDEVSLSNHNVTGAVEHSSAPGGSSTPETAVINGEERVVRWGIQFSCVSCHDPHGLGGNARLLHPDPNGVQIVRRDSEFSNYPLTPLPGQTVAYAAYPRDAGGNIDTRETPYYILKTYPYRPKIIVDGVIDKDAVIDNTSGYSIIIPSRAVTESIYATFTPALRVTMDVDNYLGNSGNGSEQLVYYEGINAFCGACHTDYNTSNTDGTSGTYSQAYRHPMGIYYEGWSSAANLVFEETGVIVCTTCHVAHGTSQDYWLRTLADEGYTAESAVELAGSSALKRKPNMALCVTCHETGETGFAHEDSIYDTDGAAYRQEGAGYVGADRCISCHERYYEKWQQTNHAAGMQPGKGAVLPDAGTFNSNFGSYGDYTVDDVVYVIGRKWRQSYLVAGGEYLQVLPEDWAIDPADWNDGGQWQVQEQDWFYGEDTADWKLRAFEDVCAGCHTTGFDRTTGGWEEIGVSCEACHGPAGKHVQVPVDLNITNPSRLTIREQNDLCGSCHARGRNLQLTYTSRADGAQYLRYDALGFQPGQRLSVVFDVYEASEDDANTYYYNSVTGSVKDSRAPHQQYNDYIQSKHYRKGLLSCISCHSSHGLNSEGVQLKRVAGQICSSCHGTVMSLDKYMPQITVNGVINSRTHTFAAEHPNPK
ncbi:MAG: hypothetical protein H0Z35_12915 [Thermoanaerobacteraceae bacterium]|nr:hypothetical protein [Thermoanaerobacteraceae bacterium]